MSHSPILGRGKWEAYDFGHVFTACSRVKTVVTTPIHIENPERWRPNLNGVLGAIFILACMNPWTSFGTNSMDSQPWPLLTGLVFLGSTRFVRAPPYIGPLSISITAGLIISIALSVNPTLTEILRAIAGYSTLIVVYFAFYNYLLRFGFPSSLLFFSAVSWLVFAFVEMVSPSIISMFAAQRTSVGRGLTSLAPEPTFFAIFLLFLSWIIFVGRNYQPSRREVFLIAANLLAIFLLARSTMVIVYIAVAAVIYSGFFVIKSIGSLRMRGSHIFAVMFALISMPFAKLLIEAFLEDTRTGRLMSTLSQKGLLAIISSDASIINRIEGSVLSIHAALYNKLIPGGLDTYLTTKELVRPFWGKIFWYPTVSNKILSWNGVLLYELGVFGLMAFVWLVLAAVRKGSASGAEIVIFAMFAMGAIPMAFPLIPMLFAVWAYNGKRMSA
ncbi:MAG: hypothetical protein COB08_012070 [Rhodobacteraceae bacterium]|nr:hypothetical protein [Paracoccaceae bacterium]